MILAASNEWIWYVAIFFWIWSAINSSKKKKKKAQEKLESVKRISRPTEARPSAPQPSPSPRVAITPQEIKGRSIEELIQAFQQRQPLPAAQQTDIDYDRTATFDPDDFDTKPAFASESTPGSHFKLETGLRTNVADMSRMPQGVPSMRSVNFGVYHQKEKIKPILEMKASALRKYFIIGEIFGKPKSLQKRS